MTISPTLLIGPLEQVSMDHTGRRRQGWPYERFAMLALVAIRALNTDHGARLDALERRLAAQEGTS